MKARWFKRGFFLVAIYAIAILESLYVPRYGLEWLLAALGATAVLAALWMRAYWDS